ncbi:hypothetical protein BD311DRAFT_15859 [Dichomitus squalens]|uniref:Uncharacterized protein n=1 Tax=Dichomitus squalens TaxID=114155 RepID=A0A4Q9N8W7_9APHY|nr:hypothetical protein BD311DRAFT_15859 [Dichomitus squalens]
MQRETCYIRHVRGCLASSFVPSPSFVSVSFFSPKVTCLTHCRTGFRTRSWYLISSCWPTNPIARYRRPVPVLSNALRFCSCTPWSTSLFLSAGTLLLVSVISEQIE